MKTIAVGVAGWSYPDWHVDMIVINSSFYRIPEVHTVASWADRVRWKPCLA